ncbi:hypothetical protein ABI59_05375 [Acidobacteria bacterium Mor1]|nr:hypothetical protein ABI59_05375 [Acidobacteria bacterium Mor1]
MAPLTRSRRGWGCFCLAVLGLLAACGGAEEAPADSAAELLWIEAGEHHLGVVPPEGWYHRDHGDSQLLQRRRHVLVFEDLGVERDRLDRPVALDLRIPGALEKLDDAAHRDEAERRSLRIDGQRFVVVDTWDRLTHTSRRRFAFTLRDGALLALYTRYHLAAEEAETQLATFDALLESVVFPPAAS